MLVNYYNFRNGAEAPFKIVVAHEKVDNLQKNYVINPKNVMAVAGSKTKCQQKMLGLLVTTTAENRFYYAECYLGRSISSRTSEFVRRTQDYLLAFYTNTIELNDLLRKAGAQIVHDKEQADLDLSPESLEKDTIFNLLVSPGT